MARPIEPTPILRGREAKRFEARVSEDLKKPCRLIPTPRLEQARRIVKEYVLERKKRI